MYRSLGYAVVPQVERPLFDSNNTETNGEQSPNGHPQYFSFPGGPSNLSFTQFPQNIFVPFQPREGTGNNIEELGSSLNVSGSQLEAQEKFLQQQIEVCYQRYLVSCFVWLVHVLFSLLLPGPCIIFSSAFEGKKKKKT